MEPTAQQIKQVMAALGESRELTPEEDRLFDLWMDRDAALQEQGSD